VYIVWQGAVGQIGVAEFGIVYTRSTDGGASFGNNGIVSEPDPNVERPNYKPQT
jgi:hypothetical protein